MTEKRIIRINASALKRSACYRNYWLTGIEGYKKPINSVAIEFGSAVHIFLKVMIETSGKFDEAVKQARTYFETTPKDIDSKKAYLDTGYLIKCCIMVWQWLQDNHSDYEILLKEDNTPAVELTFSNEVYQDDNYKVLTFIKPSRLFA